MGRFHRSPPQKERRRPGLTGGARADLLRFAESPGKSGARAEARDEAAARAGAPKVCRVSSRAGPDWELEGEEEAERLALLSTGRPGGVRLVERL